MCALHLDDDSGYSMEDLRRMIKSGLPYPGNAAVVQECLFTLSQETYMLTFNDLSWLREAAVTEIFSDVVLVLGFCRSVTCLHCF